MKNENRKRLTFNSVMRSIRIGVLLMFMAVPLFVYTNCSSSHDADLSITSEYISAETLSALRAQKTSILTNRCESCHNAATTDNNLKDILNTQYLIDNDYINPGSPQTSALYLRIVDDFMPPMDSPDVTDAELAALRDWIAVEGGNYDSYIGGTPIDGGTTTTPAPFTAVRAILNQNCVSCHRAGATPPRLDVDAATLRGAGLVIPNNAAGSPLLQSFSSMPTGGALGLNSSQANTVRSWINSGAQ